VSLWTRLRQGNQALSPERGTVRMLTSPVGRVHAQSLGDGGPANRASLAIAFTRTTSSRRGGREAEGGGLLSFPRLARFNLRNNLEMGAGTPKWGDCASFG
jgi:hypothetical protein